MIPTRRLVVNADDFGLSASVNRGIMEAHAAGTVSSTSLLVNAPGFEDAVRAAHAAPTLGVGLHLNLTMGAPVSPATAVPSLCDPRTGRFCSLSRLIARAVVGRINGGEVALECAAQIARARGAGVRLTHLDGHQHTHVLPGIWGPVVAAATGAGIDVMRLGLEPAAGIAWRPLAALGQLLLTASWRRATRGGGAPLPRHADHFRGFALTGRPDFLERLLAVLDRLEPGVTELMVHPGYADASLEGWVSYGSGRERELAALTSAAIRTRLQRGDIELIGFGSV